MFTYPARLWDAEDPGGFPNFSPLFGDSFFDFVDTSTSDDGIKRWYHKVRELGPDAPLCAFCNNGTGNSFCPADYINDTNTCLGKGFRDFKTCKRNAEADLQKCLGIGGGGTIFGGVIGFSKVGAAIVKCSATGVGIAICLAALGIVAGGVLYVCYKKYNATMEKCFNALSDKFREQMIAACNGVECPAQPD